VSSAASSASMVDFIKIVYLHDLYETVTPPKVKTYPIVTYNS
jgi:hypothetical protein